MAAEGVCSWGGPKILGDPGRYWAQSDGCPPTLWLGGPVPPRPPQFRRLCSGGSITLEKIFDQKKIHAIVLRLYTYDILFATSRLS